MNHAKWSSFGGYFFVSFLICFALYPYFFVGMRFPMMSPEGWALSDTVVSHMVFFPGWRSIFFELFENGQLLWSSTRAMGMPLMVNEIQAAPFFPLRILLSPIPEPYIWYLDVILRLSLSGAFSLALARKHMKLDWGASVFFCLCLSFSMYALRYMNHPWHNAFLAGLAYLYFLIECSGSLRVLSISGLFLSIFSLGASGFPSNAAMMGLLAWLLYFPYLLSQGRRALSLVRFSVFLAVHLAALLCLLPIALPMLEALGQLPENFRSQNGLHQVSSVLSIFGTIMRWSNGRPALELLHFFRPIPIFMFVYFFCSRRNQWQIWDLILIIPALFGILKIFPILGFFNKIVASLPVLSQSHFTIYGLCFLILPFAFYSARGFSNFLAQELRPKKILMSLGVVLLLGTASYFYHQSVGSEVRLSRAVLILPLLAVVGLKFFRPKYWSTSFFVVLGLFVYAEILFTHPSRFISTESPFYEEVMLRDSRAQQLAEQKEKFADPNIRVLEPHGLYAGLGVKTPDVGATAILTQRQQWFRELLFEAQWKGYLPIESPKKEYSDWLTASSYFVSRGSRKGLSEYGSFLKAPQEASRAFFSPGCVVLESSLEVRNAMKMDQTVRATFFLEQGSFSKATEAEICRSPARRAAGNLKILRDHGSLIELSQVEGPGLVVLKDSFYPGWHAEDIISSQSMEILPVNLALKGVWLPEPRRYQLKFEYRPDWLRASFAGPLLGLLVFLLCLWLSKNERLLN